ncbi:MAG: SusC/RagA family TonB-linked outer membrane protein [Bacteroidota bacterium]
MKKIFDLWVHSHPTLKKLIMELKIAFLIIVACVSSVLATPVYSQVAKVSLDMKNRSLEQVMDEIERQSEFYFIFNQKQIDVNRVVDIQEENKLISDILPELFKGTDVNYIVFDRKILLTTDPLENNLLSFASGTEQQQQKVTGTVTGKDGTPLPGANVVVTGTTLGAITDIEGKYSIDIPRGSKSLTFTFVGMVPQEIPIGTLTRINVTMSESAIGLDEVVVTALGITRKEKSLVYANKIVIGSELTDVKSDNLMNSLSGKVPGMIISPSASGVGGSVKVILRGNKNISGSNQPLYVIDGIPMSNISNANGQPNSSFVGGPDGGDGISNLNPDDIESISVLQGAAGSALYGSSAANGVVIITSKKGKIGAPKINFSSSYTINAISYKPKFQNKYGVTTNGNQSWGAELTTPQEKNNLSEFYQHGQNITNSFNLSSGSTVAQTYFSYANTTTDGVIPTNKLKRNNFTFRETGHFFNNKLTVDVNTNYIKQRIDNTPSMGLFLNPITGLYLFPVGEDITPYKNEYGLPNPDRNGLLRQNWITSEDLQSNPWWLLHKDPNYSTRDRLIINASMKYDFTSWLNFQVRGNIDRTLDSYQINLFSGTNPVNVVGSNGAFTGNQQIYTHKYGDAIANFKIPSTSLFRLDGLLGASIVDNNSATKGIGQGLGLYISNIFLAQNVRPSVSGYISSGTSHSQSQSVFGSLNLSYNDWLFISATGRNDWSSSLAFTSNLSYFYPSVGASLVLNEVLNLPSFITFAKVRGSYAEVATTVPQYIQNS